MSVWSSGEIGGSRGDVLPKGTKVSVIIPTYNRARQVEEAVRSVLAQTGKVSLDLVVVDDGSTDDTRERLSRLEPSVQVIHQAHHGVSSARNKGLAFACGEWVAFLDSDDLWLPQKLRRQCDFLAGFPEFFICQTEEIWIRNGRRLNPGKCHAKPRGFCFSRLLERCLISPSAVMIHRKVFEEVGKFDEDFPACEDYEFWLRVGARYPVGLLDEPLVIKRGGHPDQLSTSIPALDRYRIQALVKLLKETPLNSAQRALAIEELGRKCRIYGHGCLKRGKLEEGERILRLPGQLAAEL